MSPYALQVYAWTQRPPWQFVEQHSDPAAQAFPSVVQLPATVDTTAHAPFVHVPEQHCEPEEHDAPMTSHAAAAHVPDVHASEQHSVPDVQDSPELLQKPDEVHLPDAQTVEQHCDPLVQVSPPTPHAATGGAVHLRSAPHLPEQHCP
jgi:hypothetical protein